jgi:hypothetical protein
MPDLGGHSSVPLFYEMFSSVESVCFDFTFVNDLFDPGEILLITPLQLFPSLTGPGFENGGDAPQAERTFCADSSLPRR